MPKPEEDIGIDKYILELEEPTSLSVRTMLEQHPEIGSVSLKYIRERRRILSEQRGGAEQDRDSATPVPKKISCESVPNAHAAKEPELLHENIPAADEIAPRESGYIKVGNRKILSPEVYEIVREHRQNTLKDTAQALKKRFGMDISPTYVSVLRTKVDKGEIPPSATTGIMGRSYDETKRRGGLVRRDPRIYSVVELLKDKPKEQTVKAVEELVGKKITGNSVLVIRHELKTEKRLADEATTRELKPLLLEKGYPRGAGVEEISEVTTPETEPSARVFIPIALIKKESEPPKEDSSWKKDARVRRGIYDIVSRYRAANPEFLSRAIFNRFRVELTTKQIAYVRREMRKQEEAERPPAPEYSSPDGEPAVDVPIIDLGDMKKAIRNSIDREGMEEEAAEHMAESVMNFFGYSDRIIDNILEPEDRDFFYMLEDAGLLTTEREETTLYDGREWKIHYWVLKVGEIEKLALSLEKKEAKEKVKGVYTEEDSAGMWGEAFLKRGQTEAAATEEYGNSSEEHGAVVAGPMRPGLMSEPISKTYGSV